MGELIYRSELKHVISCADGLVIKSRLAHALRRDAHADSDGSYHVRSLYFDTPDNRAYHDKLDGVPMREKFRIRFYNLDPRFIRLEKKIKRYGGGAKLMARLSEAQTRQIMDGEIGFLRESEQALLREFYVRMKADRLQPRTIVDYRRTAYLCAAGNVRVTVDSDIRASISSLDLFDPDLPTASAFDPNKCILEVKFDEFLPAYIQELIQLNNCSATAASKYTACRIYM